MPLRSALALGLLLLSSTPHSFAEPLSEYLEGPAALLENPEAREGLFRITELLEVNGGGVRVCGTALWTEVRRLDRNLSPSGRRALAAALGPLAARPALDTFYDAPAAPVRVHYSVTGSSTVRDVTDTLPDGHPRYVHEAAGALTRAYQLLIDSLGYLPPLSDSGLGGGQSLYDCYLAISPYAGFTASELGYGRVVGNDTIIAASAYMVVHPTMAGLGITVDPYDYMRITCAHEFFHAVHFAYDVEEKPSWQLYGFWLEGTAVWFEDYAFPDVNDWSYLPFYMNAPERSLTHSTSPADVRPYGAGSLWTFYLVERFGGPGILRDIWNRCGLVSGDNTLAATDSVLTARGSSLDQAWHEFAGWCMRTGSRAGSGGFAQAAQWPEVEPATVLFTYPAAVHFTNGADPLAGSVPPGVPIATIGAGGSAVGALGFAALGHLPFPSQLADSSQRLYVEGLPALPSAFAWVGRDTVGSVTTLAPLPAGDTTLVPSWLRYDTLFVVASSGLHYDAGDDADDPPATITPLLTVALDSAGADVAGILFSEPYPNPMVRPGDASVTFQVEIPQAGRVYLDVFTLSGVRVRSQSRSASVWPPASMVWDGRNDQGRGVASGLYLCKLTVELSDGERQEKLYRVGVVR